MDMFPHTCGTPVARLQDGEPLRLFHEMHIIDHEFEISVCTFPLQVAGVFTNLFGGVAGSKYGLRCTLLTSLFLQVRGLERLNSHP